MAPPFAQAAADPDATLDRLALALAGELRPRTDVGGALGRLDELAGELRAALEGAVEPVDAEAEATACALVLGRVHGFTGDREQYDRPENSMLDVVLERRRGLPILLSAVYTEVGRRAGVALSGVGLPGHFVVGHFGADPPILLDPFDRGAMYVADAPAVLLRPWSPHETAMRMLNNLVLAFERRGDLARQLRAAQMRLDLPADGAVRATLEAELKAITARLN
jgi:regulator of sirC expression with transglutaminase-like and TPR domain